MTGATAALVLVACGSPATSDVYVQPKMGHVWTQVDWRQAFTAEQSRSGSMLAGHPLDVAFDATGAAWTLGEFGMQAARYSNGATSTHAIPLKSYGSWQWTKPFASSFQEAPVSSSELGESVVSTPDSVWVAQGGQQNHAATGNHSLLTRYSTTAPFEACQVPLPGDNNEVIGLAYDSKRDRIWFAESEGDHLHGSGYSTIGWVKASGLGTRCQNDLDYADPAAQQTLNDLECDVSQGAEADCIHTVTTPQTMPSGATHLTYDAADDALWLSNWADRKLRRLDIAADVWTTYPAPPSPLDWPIAWQIAANATHVFVNEYEGNRLLSFNKATKTWVVLAVPVSSLKRAEGTLITPGSAEVHSISLDGNALWFTVSDEDGNAVAAVGSVDVQRWAMGTPRAKLYVGWHTLPGTHSFRGIDVQGGRIAVTDHADGATVVLTRAGW